MPSMLYMSLFLHQTTTSREKARLLSSCICPFSYIKPQHAESACPQTPRCICPFSYIKPQHRWSNVSFTSVVYVPFPTSNHNRWHRLPQACSVVYVPFPTSNHNQKGIRVYGCLLYMSLFLHQTTTKRGLTNRQPCCICPFSYIKPQRHNEGRNRGHRCICPFSYIKPQRWSSTNS